jgi:protein-disulfide isomerase
VRQSTTRSAPPGRRWRWAATAVAVALALGAVSDQAWPEPAFTIDPAMTRGPATAPVTIVEFSDYQ